MSDKNGITIQVVHGHPLTFDKKGYEDLFNGVPSHPIEGFGSFDKEEYSETNKPVKYKGTIK